MEIIKNNVKTFYKNSTSGFVGKSLLILSLAPVLAFAAQSNTLSFTGFNKNDSFKLQSFVISAAYVTNCDSCSENAQVQVSNNNMTFDANRQDGSATVSFAKQQMSSIGVSWNASDMLGTTGTNIAMPTQLNFFLEGTLAFKYNGSSYVCDNFMVAQGHDNGENNWWGFTNISTPLPTIPKGDIWYSYRIQCNDGIGNNPQTLWVSTNINDHTLAISDQPLYGQPYTGSVDAM